jgi:hypothetical protein
MLWTEEHEDDEEDVLVGVFEGVLVCVHVDEAGEQDGADDVDEDEAEADGVDEDEASADAGMVVKRKATKQRDTSAQPGADGRALIGGIVCVRSV